MTRLPGLITSRSELSLNVSPAIATSGYSIQNFPLRSTKPFKRTRRAVRCHRPVVDAAHLHCLPPIEPISTGRSRARSRARRCRQRVAVGATGLGRYVRSDESSPDSQVAASPALPPPNATSSGAFVGGKIAARKEFLSNGQIKNPKADIVPPDDFNIVIESKAYGDFPWHRLIQQEAIPQLEVWLEEIYACIDDNDFWLLCVKIDYKGWFVLFDPNFSTFDYLNHSTYYSPTHKKTYIITAPLEGFLENNKDKLIALMQK